MEGDNVVRRGGGREDEGRGRLRRPRPVRLNETPLPSHPNPRPYGLRCPLPFSWPSVGMIAQEIHSPGKPKMQHILLNSMAHSILIAQKSILFQKLVCIHGVEIQAVNWLERRIINSTGIEDELGIAVPG